MGLHKGHTNNTKGRPKGKPNKITKDIREFYRMLLEKNQTAMISWITRTARKNPAEAAKLFLSMSEFIIPKQQRTEIASDFDKMTDEQVEHVIEELKKKQYGS